MQSQPTSTMITSTIGRQWRLSQSQPDAVTVTAAAVDVTLSAAVREDPPTIDDQMSAAIAERKVRDVMLTLDGASKAEATGGDTTEAESSAKRQAAIRAMLG